LAAFFIKRFFYFIFILYIYYFSTKFIPIFWNNFTVSSCKIFPTIWKKLSGGMTFPSGKFIPNLRKFFSIF